jgi:hypothetical protein
MKRRIGYALLAVCAYLGFLIAQLPAAQLYGRLLPRTGAPLQLYQVSGSVWDGRAAAAVVGKTRIDAPVWVWRPQALLLGRIEYGLTGRLDGAPVTSIIGRGPGNPFYADDARITLPLNDAVGFLGLRDVGLSGQFTIELRHLEVRAQKIAALDATLNIADAAFGPPVNVALGGAAMRLESSGDIIKGVLKDSGGPLQADGVLIYQPSGDYQFSLSLSARDPNDTQLRQALRFLGTPNAAGKVSLSRRGRIDIGSYF